MPEQKDERTYIRVHDGMPDHPKVEALSDKAFRLLVSTWCWCSRHLTDGRVPLAVWRKRGTPATRRELADAGLVEPQDGHVVMHDYLEHQRSADEVEEKKEAKRRAGALGNHNRWHVPRNVYDPGCPVCVENGLPKSSHNRSQVRSQTGSQNDRKTSPETETETENYGETWEGEVTRATRERPPAPENPNGEPRPPDRCERHAGVDHPPPCGKCADARRAAETWDTEHARQQAAERSAEARRRAELRAAAIANCQLCDPDGLDANRRVCDHDPAATDRAARGRAAVQAALSRTTGSTETP